MRRLVTVLTLAAAMLLAAAADPLPADATNRRCAAINDGGGLVITSLRSSGASCATARRVARGWRATDGCGDKLDGGRRRTCRVRSFTCRSQDTATGAAAILVDCRRGRRSVSFVAGS